MRVLLLILAIFATFAHAKHRTYTVCENNGQLGYIKEGRSNDNEICEKRLASAYFRDEINSTGWAFLEVDVISNKIPHYLQGYAAGFAEGRATRHLIDMHILNTVEGYCDGAEYFCEELKEFMTDNFEWVMNEIKQFPEDEYWQQVNLTLNQLFGLIHGYENTIGIEIDIQKLAFHPITMIQIAGDLEDLALKFKKPENLKKIFSGPGHCSALVKLLPNNADILFSHVTWSSYSTMLRISKKYSFKTGDPGQSYSFSSYPASITSTDDFILTSAKLAILETTIGNYNEKSLDLITPKTVLTWIRAEVAHRVASSGLQWSEAFGRHNSGTYNNEWVIVDYKQFHAGRKMQKDQGIIHVVEQMPGHIVHSDMTQHLFDTSYWPGYNQPYFKQIIRLSATDKMVEKYGDWYSYDKTPRALIFKRDHHTVVDMDSMIAIMTSNNYKHDPLSRCNCTPPYSAENAIACRSDLNPQNGTYPFKSLGFRDHGAIDVKVTNSKLINTLQFTAISGPPHGNVPVFDWNTSVLREKVPHFGQPARWTFKPVTYKWRKSHHHHHYRKMVDF